MSDIKQNLEHLLIIPENALTFTFSFGNDILNLHFLAGYTSLTHVSMYLGSLNTSNFLRPSFVPALSVEEKKHSSMTNLVLIE